MNVPSIPLAGTVAGVSLSAAKGGEADKQSAAASDQTNQAEKPAGKDIADLSIQQGEHASDRDGNGRQLLDVFERSEEESGKSNDDDLQQSPRLDQHGGLDFLA